MAQRKKDPSPVEMLQDIASSAVFVRNVQEARKDITRSVIKETVETALGPGEHDPEAMRKAIEDAGGKAALLEKVQAIYDSRRDQINEEAQLKLAAYDTISAFVNSEDFKTIKESLAALADTLLELRPDIEAIVGAVQTVQDLAPYLEAELEALKEQPEYKGYTVDDLIEMGLDEEGNIVDGPFKEIYERAKKRKAEIESAGNLVANVERAAKTIGAIRQGPITNALTKMIANARNTKTDALANTMTIRRGSYSLSFDGNNIKGPRVSTYQLFDAITGELTRTGANSPNVRLPLKEYMRMRGLSDVKAARQQVEEDLETLFQGRISAKSEGAERWDHDFQDIRICQAKGINRGVIHFSYGQRLYEFLKTYTIMPWQKQLLEINGKRNPNSYFLLRKIMEHKNMNVGKNNENRISVKTLLENCPSIPSYDEVKAGRSGYDRKIIGPFERDMDALSDTLSWEYCHSNGEPLTDAETAKFDYSIFSDCLIQVTWNEYPDQTRRLEKQAAKREEAKAKKTTRKKSPPKKKGNSKTADTK